MNFERSDSRNSKKVQQHIQSVTKSVLNSGGTRRERQLEEKRKEERAALKARKKAEKDEQDALFGAALLNIQKKTTTSKKEGKNEAKGRDADDEGTKKGTSRAMKMMFQMDAQEMEAKLKEDVSAIDVDFLLASYCSHLPKLSLPAKLHPNIGGSHRGREAKEGGRAEGEWQGNTRHARIVCDVDGKETKTERG